MDDAIVITSGTFLRCRHNVIDVVPSLTDYEDAPNVADLEVLRLGSVVTCGAGATTLAKRMSLPKDFKRQEGTVLVIHIEAAPDEHPRLVELGVQIHRGGFGW